MPNRISCKLCDCVGYHFYHCIPVYNLSISAPIMGSWDSDVVSCSLSWLVHLPWVGIQLVKWVSTLTLHWLLHDCSDNNLHYLAQCKLHTNPVARLPSQEHITLFEFTALVINTKILLHFDHSDTELWLQIFNTEFSGILNLSTLAYIFFNFDNFDNLMLDSSLQFRQCMYVPILADFYISIQERSVYTSLCFFSYQGTL